MVSIRWWHCGLLGGVVLSLATFIKVIGAVVTGAMVEAGWTEAAGFVATIFGMGFLCGVVAWAGRGLSRRFGMVGDAMVGMGVMLIFFASCMLLFSPEMLGKKLSVGGLPMFGLGAILGLVGGAWTGRDLRRALAKQESWLSDTKGGPPPAN